uniref:Uncharacterized protein n=1 Tax=Pithovirus LCPAC403 TaxID=2506596 RepID=A0A481ZDS8_9VIRU|nr:MAG: hypothetical protein LCPAC403_03330 [Pithovirus LCPAC403]
MNIPIDDIINYLYQTRGCIIVLFDWIFIVGENVELPRSLYLYNSPEMDRPVRGTRERFKAKIWEINNSMVGKR